MLLHHFQSALDSHGIPYEMIGRKPYIAPENVPALLRVWQHYEPCPEIRRQIELVKHTLQPTDAAPVESLLTPGHGLNTDTRQAIAGADWGHASVFPLRSAHADPRGPCGSVEDFADRLLRHPQEMYFLCRLPVVTDALKAQDLWWLCGRQSVDTLARRWSPRLHVPAETIAARIAVTSVFHLHFVPCDWLDDAISPYMVLLLLLTYDVVAFLAVIGSICTMSLPEANATLRLPAYRETPRRLSARLSPRISENQSRPKKLFRRLERFIAEQWTARYEVWLRHGAVDGFFEEQCAICLDADATVQFLPCKHVTCCGDCAVQFAMCPMCRAEVVERQPAPVPAVAPSFTAVCLPTVENRRRQNHKAKKLRKQKRRQRGH